MDEESKISQFRQERLALLKQRAELEKAQLREGQAMNQTVSEMTYETEGTGMSNSSSKNMERGKTLTLSNGHSILGDNNGFMNMLIMTLLAGFASGVIAMAIYIFINLGKVTVSL